MLEAIGVADHLPEPGCPIRRIAVADGLEPGGLHFDRRRRRAARLDAREPPSARRAAGAAPRPARISGCCGSRAVDRRRARRTWRDRRARGRPQARARRCWSPPTAAIRRRARRPESASRAGNTIIRRSSRCSATNGRTTMSPMRSSIRPGPFALLPMTDDDGGHRSAIVWSVPDERCGRLAVAERRGFRRRGRGGDGRLPRQDRAARAALVLSRSASTMRRRSPPSGWRWSATPPTPSTRSPARASTSASATPRRWPRCWSKARGSGLDLGDRQLLDRYQRWRSLDALVGRLRDRQPDPHLRHSRPDRLGGPPLRHGPGRPDRAAQGPADERSARHQRRPAAAASRAADLDSY